MGSPQLGVRAPVLSSEPITPPSVALWLWFGALGAGIAWLLLSVPLPGAQCALWVGLTECFHLWDGARLQNHAPGSSLGFAGLSGDEAVIRAGGAACCDLERVPGVGVRLNASLCSLNSRRPAAP